MGFSLVVVESPAKAKTITSFLTNCKVEASKGHIRDLPKYILGVRFENGKVLTMFDITKDHKDIVKRLKAFGANADKVYIATDEDREGEAIGYHIATVLNLDIKTVDRIAFHEITKSAIQHAISNPRRLNMDMVHSQMARRILDRVVGFNLSSFLSSKVSNGLTAGRVQSSTLSLVVDREREIMDFKPVKYYIINGVFEESLEGTLTHINNKKLEQTELQEKDKVDQLVSILNNSKFKILSIEKTKRKVKPLPPFTTSTLQQTASNKLGYSPDTTMKLAQKLYEGVPTHNGVMGVITYMRTDSLNIAKEAQLACRDFIKSNHGEKYLNNDIRYFTTNTKGAQEAHEAIRPTKLDFTPEIAKKYLDDNHYKLYSLIYNRFMATQSTEAVFENTKCKIIDLEEKYLFEVNGSIMVFDGFQHFTGVEHKAKVLPELKEGTIFNNSKITPTEKETQPPGRYTEASLVTTMEKLGIGRPSTYASTTSLLVKRKYVVKEGKSLVPTKEAFLIVDTLRKYFPIIVDVKFTAEMESKLDDIGRGELNWESYLTDFYKDFSELLKSAKENMVSLKPEAIKTGEICPECEGEIVIRSGKFGTFKGCSNYPKCKYIVPNSTVLSADYIADFKCPLCGGDVLIRNGKFGKYFECDNRKKEDKKCSFINKFKPIENKKCEKCGNYLVLKYKKEFCGNCDYKPFNKDKKNK